MSLLGLDIGTTGTKAVAFTPEGAILASAYREYPLIHPRQGWIELDPNQVWNAVCEVLREVGKATKNDPPKALAISCQGEAFMPVDKDGSVLANAIVTFDNRADGIAKRIGEQIGARRIMEITGFPLSGIYTINKIIWWRENHPEIYEKTWKFLCFEDFAFLRMGLEPVIDTSLAARVMVLDLKTRDWSDELLSELDVDKEVLPRVAPSGTVVGRIPDNIADELNLPHGIVAVKVLLNAYALCLMSLC